MRIIRIIRIVGVALVVGAVAAAPAAAQQAAPRQDTSTVAVQRRLAKGMPGKKGEFEARKLRLLRRGASPAAKAAADTTAGAR